MREVLIKDLEGSVKRGIFTFPCDREFQGELKLAGRESFLSLEIDKSLSGGFKGVFPDSGQNVKCIKGVLNDSKKVSLLYCLANGFGFCPAGEGFTYNNNFFPNFAVFGNQHISHDEKKITGVSFIIDDADILFYDPNLFGAITSSDKATILRSLIEQIAQYNDLGPKIEIAKHPQVFYYSGKTKIFEAKARLGTISASHGIKKTFGSSKGFKIVDIISVNLEFTRAVTFKDAVDKAFRVLRFLELLVDRPQNLQEFFIRKETEQTELEELEVYGSFFPRYKRPEDKLLSFKTLITAVQNPEEFSRLLTNWLERDDSRLYARNKFFYSFGKQIYDVDRLISAADMFDVLPKEDSPHKVELDKEIKIAVEKSKTIWEDVLECTKKNNESKKRCESILGTLNRLEKSVTLREKICYRAEKVIEKIGDKVPDLVWLIGKAVTCRNHYTHKDQLETIENCDKVKNFLTDTLEFVFATSELIEAGWDIEAWDYNKSSHRFGYYLRKYENDLGNHREDLKQLKN